MNLPRRTLLLAAAWPPASFQAQLSGGLVQERLALAEFDPFIVKEIRDLGKLVRASGITPE